MSRTEDIIAKGMHRRYLRWLHIMTSIPGATLNISGETYDQSVLSCSSSKASVTIILGQDWNQNNSVFISTEAVVTIIGRRDKDHPIDSITVHTHEDEKLLEEMVRVVFDPDQGQAVTLAGIPWAGEVMGELLRPPRKKRKHK